MRKAEKYLLFAKIFQKLRYLSFSDAKIYSIWRLVGRRYQLGVFFCTKYEFIPNCMNLFGNEEREVVDVIICLK